MKIGFSQLYFNVILSLQFKSVEKELLILTIIKLQITV